MARSPKTRAWIQKAALLAFSLVASLAIAEGLLRAFPSFLSDEARFRIHWSTLLSAETVSLPDARYGYLYPPNHTATIRRGEFGFTYTTDSRGFRNPGPWPDSADVVAVGDSQTFGYGVEDDQAWPRILETLLPGRKVVNLGLNGAGPQQYERLYEDLGQPLHPRVVLLGLYPANDFSDARWFQDWLDAGSPGNSHVWRFFGGDMPGAERSLRTLLRRSYLWSLFKEARTNIGARSGSRSVEFEDGSRIRLIPAALEDNARLARPGQAEFSMVIEAIERVREIASSGGTELLVVVFPAKEEVHLPLLGEAAPDATSPLLEELDRRGIAYLDLHPTFRERAAAGERLFFEIDTHPNPAGAALIARTIADRLRDDFKN